MLEKPMGLPLSDMSWSPSHRRFGLLAIAAAALFMILYWQHPSSSSYNNSTASQLSSSSSLAPSSGSQQPSKGAGAWTFSASKDRNNHALSAEQCLATFPDLYHEIDRSQAFWKQRQGDAKLTEDQWSLDWSIDGGLRVLIYNQQLFVIESRGLNHFQHWRERSQATLHNLHRAILASPEPVPNIEFSIKINDDIGLKEHHRNNTVWNFSRNVTDPVMDQVWLIPDFNFWSYPRVAGAYGDYQRQAMEVDAGDYAGKKSQLIWRGTVDFNPGVRKALLNQSTDKSWSAVHSVKEDNNDPDNLKWRIAMPDHCRYKFAVHTEGTTWSGRLKYLLSCHSTIVIHPLTFTTHLYHLLEGSGPDQNYVPVRLDFSDLPDAMDALLQNPAEAEKIADNAARKFRDRYFTPAAQSCYFRQLFRVWAEMTETPNPYGVVEHPDGRREQVWRGMTYEEYVFWDKSYPLE